jgi:hypothetical protein
MPLKYRSGEEVMKGDRVLFHRDPGEVEFVADPLFHDADTLWFVEQFGKGIKITKLKQFGTVFDDDPEEDDELEFVCRGEATTASTG